MKITNLASLAIAGFALGVVTTNINQATAATVQYHITVNNLDGSLTGNEFTGEFSFDDAKLSGSGSEFLPVSDLSFVFQGTTFTEDDDLSGNPEVEFFDGDFLGLSYSVDADFSFIPGFFDLSDSFFAYDLGSGDVGTGDTIYRLDPSDPNPNPPTETVPEPNTIIAILSTAILAHSLRKNRA